jgi:hypothetical protein
MGLSYAAPYFNIRWMQINLSSLFPIQPRVIHSGTEIDG